MSEIYVYTAWEENLPRTADETGEFAKDADTGEDEDEADDTDVVRGDCPNCT